ncbi:MAG: hypothetical protein H6709_16750 [Kofleriaceae bacterium]|nr:hypothetical protein [Kofleriaceae bacterium]
MRVRLGALADSDATTVPSAGSRTRASSRTWSPSPRTMRPSITRRAFDGTGALLDTTTTLRPSRSSARATALATGWPYRRSLWSAASGKSAMT